MWITLNEIFVHILKKTNKKYMDILIYIYIYALYNFHDDKNIFSRQITNNNKSNHLAKLLLFVTI